jgi:hypothetical protein
MIFFFKHIKWSNKRRWTMHLEISRVPRFLLAIVLIGIWALPALVVEAKPALHLAPAARVARGFGQDAAGNVFLPSVAVARPAQQPQHDEARAIQLLAALPDVAQHLAVYPGWRADAYQEEGSDTIWNVDFYQEDEWLGWGKVDLASDTVLDHFVPRELSPEEFAAGQALVETFIKHDPEIRARLAEPSLWGHDTSYNRWDTQWQVWYWYGIDALVANLNIYDGTVYLDSLEDPNQLDAAERAEADRNRAVELAYGAQGVDQALAGFDDWRTYVEEQGGARYTVSFVSGAQTRFAALVDIAQGTVVETRP